MVLAKLVSGLACLGMWLLSGLPASFGLPFPTWLQIALVAAGFGLVFWRVPDIPGDTSRNASAAYEDRWRKAFAVLAEAKDWSLRLIHPSVSFDISLDVDQIGDGRSGAATVQIGLNAVRPVCPDSMTPDFCRELVSRGGSMFVEARTVGVYMDRTIPGSHVCRL